MSKKVQFSYLLQQNDRFLDIFLQQIAESYLLAHASPSKLTRSSWCAWCCIENLLRLELFIEKAVFNISVC